MFAAALLLAAATASPDIVVTAQRPAELRAVLEACRAARCPPDKDMAAALALAEAQFVQGDYGDARNVVRESLVRHRAAAAAHPRLVAGLHRANGRISLHLGDGDAAQDAIGRAFLTVERHLPSGAPERVTLGLELADMWLRLGKIDRARRAYENLTRETAGSALPWLGSVVQLRLALVDMAYRDRSAAERRLRAVAAELGPERAATRRAARVMLLRALRGWGEPVGDTEVDALVAELRASGDASGPARQALVFSPPLDLGPDPGERARAPREPLTRLEIDQLGQRNYHRTFVDLGFYVTPAGRVAEAEVLRASGDDWWHEKLLGQVRGRIYTPGETIAGVPGQYRIERFTLTALLEDRVGSRLQVRAGRPRVESLDLTVEPTGG